MASSFPTAQPSAKTDFDSSTQVASSFQNAQGEDINAIAAKLGHGTNDNSPASGKLLHGTGSGTSEWDIDLLDEDDMASDSATAVPSQQSTKAHIDHKTAGQLYLSAAGGWASTTNGCADPTIRELATNDIDIFYMAFDQTTQEHAQWTVVMPSNWDGGTVTAQFYWTTQAGGAAETVDWGIQGVSLANDDALDASWGTGVTVTDTWIADDDLHVSAATSAVTVAGAGASELVQFRVYRDVANDDLGGDAELLGVMINFTRSDS